jgi:hypothetical protein
MSEVEMKEEVETEDFADELSDEAIDRAEDGTYFICSYKPSRISSAGR